MRIQERAEMNIEQASQTFKHHLASPNVSVADYLNGAMDEIGRKIANRRKLYLDTRYWVFIREAALGRPRASEHATILALLRRYVAAGKAVCPVSDVTFMEMTTQTDDVTRLATAELWDELSLGVALQSEQDRVQSELAHFFDYPDLASASWSMQDRVWAKACFVLGATVPVNEAASPAANRAMQKSAIDVLWPTSFVEMAKKSAAELANKEGFDRTAAQINADMRRFAHQVASLEQAFLAEIVGALDVSKHAVGKVVIDLYEKRGNSLEGVTTEQLNDFHAKTMGMLVNCFRFARKKMAQRVPSLYVHALCHAAIRMDVTRRVNGNFLRDLHHGTAAVAYHDAMFTERPLEVLLTAGNVAVDKEFDCRVLSAERDVIAYLEGLQAV